MPEFIISGREAGSTVADVLRSHLAVSSAEARRLIHERRVRVGGVPCLDPQRRVKRGQRLQVLTVHPSGTTEFVIRFADQQVVVVDKPPGLTTMRHASEAAEFGTRGRRYLPPTLADLLPSQLAQGPQGRIQPVRAVHRLDKETSGLVVFARTPQAERHLGQQFRAHTIERRYLAIVRGRAHAARIESQLVPDRGDHRRGSTTRPGQGKRAVTNVRVLEELGEYTLVECRLETGRTHQVRIHLAEGGTPLCGERIYDRPLHGKPVPDRSGAPRLALHAASLSFDHPATGKRMTWQSPLPKDLAALVNRLRKRD